MNDLDKILDMEPMIREKTDVVVPADPSQDAEVARQNVYELVGAVKDAVREMGDLAFTSQSSRGYEVLGQLIEKGLAANRELLEIAKRKRDLEMGEGPKTINNTLVMSSSEILDLVKKKV